MTRREASVALPGVRLEHNLRLIAHHTLDGAPNVGEGMAMKITGDGRRLLYVANENPPVAMSILDVTDPAAPELITQLPCEHDSVRGNSLALAGDILLLAKQVTAPGMTPAGFDLFDVSTPDQPEEVGFFDASGPHSVGTHFVSTFDGRYAHISTGAADFEPNDPRDYQFYMIVDISDPTAPHEVGRWWLPGQRKGDTEHIVRHEHIDFAFRVHHTLSYPERPDRAYLGYIDGGVVILDIADPNCRTRVSPPGSAPACASTTSETLSRPRRSGRSCRRPRPAREPAVSATSSSTTGASSAQRTGPTAGSTSSSTPAISRLTDRTTRE